MCHYSSLNVSCYMIAHNVRLPNSQCCDCATSAPLTPIMLVKHKFGIPDCIASASISLCRNWPWYPKYERSVKFLAIAVKAGSCSGVRHYVGWFVYRHWRQRSASGSWQCCKGCGSCPKQPRLAWPGRNWARDPNPCITQAPFTAVRHQASTRYAWLAKAEHFACCGSLIISFSIAEALNLQ